jgi:3'(2'), 5'-bisphosphate nucleotidase
MPEDFLLNQQLQDEIIDVAYEAGKAILEVYYASENQASAELMVHTSKDDASPLTVADLASDRIIKKALKKLTPNIPIVSEEDNHSELADTQVSTVYWLVDPLDGTKEFIERSGEFTVNIGLISNGLPIWGVVYLPYTDTMYWGGKTIGSWKRTSSETKKIQTKNYLAEGRAPKIVASKKHNNQATLDFIHQFEAFELVQAGSSLKFCLIAEGSADLYPRMAPTYEWDTAAAQAVLEGAGGKIRVSSGGILLYGKGNRLNAGFIASND